jgi:hypothetical protein
VSSRRSSNYPFLLELPLTLEITTVMRGREGREKREER